MLRRIGYALGLLLVLLLILALVVLVPMLTRVSAGPANIQSQPPGSPVATSTASDGRTRTIEVFAADGVTPATLTAVQPGDRFVVRGSGFDAGTGIYVASCRIPDDPTEKPSPCLGGIPENAQASKAPSEQNTAEFLETSWITSSWAWRAFATGSYEDETLGTFTAYLIIPEGSADGLDCATERCGIITRNDHTAASDRGQDLYVPFTMK